MRRISLLIVVAFATVTGVGCVVVKSVRKPPADRQVVVLDGEMYVVDTRTRRVERLDPHATTDSTTRTTIEVLED